MNGKKTIFVFLIIILSVFNGCIEEKNSLKIKAVAGVMDLRPQEENKNRIVDLDGEWEFYWNQLIEPHNFEKTSKTLNYIEVPKAWNHQAGVHFPAHGYATYRLRILHKHDSIGQIKTIYMPFVHTAYTLWVNGRVVGKNGIVGITKSAMTPFQQPFILQFVIESPVTELVLQISNFQQRTGGLLKSISYGNYAEIARQKETRTVITLFVASSIFIILLYHFGLYIINKAYMPNLFFALFCLALLIRLTLTEEKLFVKYLPHLPWHVYLRIEYVMMLSAMIFIVHYAFSLFKNKIPVVVVRIFDGYFGFFIILSLFLDIMHLSYSLLFMQIGMIFCVIYVSFISIKENRKRKGGAWLHAIGVLVLFITFINDILYARQIINSIYLIEAGLLAFIFTQSVIALEETVIIQNRLVTINNELEVARRIQKTILPADIPSTGRITIETCYIPMDEVGGDYYHFYQLQPDKIGILIADVTGHGIPASLIASSVNLAFNLQKNNAEYPDKVMKNMNAILYGKTGGQPVSALYVYIDCGKMIAKFSRAGHPQPLVWQGDTGRVIELDVPGKIIGAFKSINAGVVTFPLKVNDRIILYTDGIIDVRNEKGEMFGEERFISFLESNCHKSCRELLDAVVNIVVKWAGGKSMIKDDITIIVANVNS